MKKIITAAIACLLSTQAFSSEAMIVRFGLSDSIKSLLRQNEFDILGINHDRGEIEALLSQEELDLLRSQKAEIKFSFPQGLALAPDEEYMNPQKVEDYLKSIHARFPTITEIVEVGRSLEGRPIWGLKISDNPQLDEAEPSVLFNGMHHAREVMTSEIGVDIIDYLTESYGKKPEVTNWVDQYAIWVIPMFNVDGNNKVWTENSLWRKNTRDGHGVDLNRNYPATWNNCKGSSSSTRAQDYRGASAGSEPETQAMMAFVAKTKPVFSISYHSYSEVVLYPFGCSPKKTLLTESVQDIGKEIGRRIDYKAGTPWELLYSADGSDIDWFYLEHQVIPYVIEVNSNREGFQPDYKKWRNKTVQRNRPGWMYLLERLQGPSLQGHVAQGEFTHVKISNSGESNPFQTYRINPDGSYYIILKPGKYDFVFEGKERTHRLTEVNVQTQVNLSL